MWGGASWWPWVLSLHLAGVAEKETGSIDKEREGGLLWQCHALRASLLRSSGSALDVRLSGLMQ